MDKTVVFTIRDYGKSCSVTNKQYAEHSRAFVPKTKLYDTMIELADIFNNELGLGILFEVE